MTATANRRHLPWLLLTLLVLVPAAVTQSGCNDPPCRCDGACSQPDGGPGADGQVSSEAGADLTPAGDAGDLGAADRGSPDAAAQCSELWPCRAGYCCDKATGTCKPCTNTCVYRPPPGSFDLVAEWHWSGPPTGGPQVGYAEVMTSPMVVNLTDDNKDGKIDLQDTPDVVFTSFLNNKAKYNVDGVLRVISGDTGKEHTSITQKTAAYELLGGGQVAVGDIDGDGRPEILACGEHPGVKPPPAEVGLGIYAFEDDGTLKWHNKTAHCVGPSITDLEGDGKAEVVSCFSALEGSTGKALSGGQGCLPRSLTVAVDLDGDGVKEVASGNRVYAFDKSSKTLSMKWEVPGTSAVDWLVAVADLDGDGKPELVGVEQAQVWAYHHDGKPYWKDSAGKARSASVNVVSPPPGDKCPTCGGGPPTVADFDGDGKPEIGVAGGFNYAVFEHDGTLKWFAKTTDFSSRGTGSSVFDFDGDGRAEVVYNDEVHLRVYDGTTGQERVKICNNSGTLRELPVVVDVDNDGQAEIVVANNAYAPRACPDGTTATRGVKAYGDKKKNWVKTRRVWNQHAYFITNVEEDGTLPKSSTPNWKNPNLNNFRQNLQPLGIFDAPDLTAAVKAQSCAAGTASVTVTVENRGAARVAAGVPVTLYLVDPTAGDVALGTMKTTGAIEPGGTETLTVGGGVPGTYLGKTVDLVVQVDDDGKGNSTVNECKEQNNRVAAGKVSC